MDEVQTVLTQIQRKWPCPFCGGRQLDLLSQEGHGSFGQIICGDCHLTSPLRHTLEDLEESWSSMFFLSEKASPEDRTRIRPEEPKKDTNPDRPEVKKELMDISHMVLGYLVAKDEDMLSIPLAKALDRNGSQCDYVKEIVARQMSNGRPETGRYD